MNTTTKNTLLIASIILLFSAGTCLFFVYKINDQGTKLDEYIKALDERQAQESSFIRISKLVLETEKERAEIASAFFSDEGDSITFLGEIESFAASIGLDLKTENLNKIIGSDKKTEYITMTFVYSGEEKQVLDFNQLLENIPYHSQVESLSIKKRTGNEWESRLTLHIMIQPT
jgi:hypothetical protein